MVSEITPKKIRVNFTNVSRWHNLIIDEVEKKTNTMYDLGYSNAAVYKLTTL